MQHIYWQKLFNLFLHLIELCEKKEQTQGRIEEGTNPEEEQQHMTPPFLSAPQISSYPIVHKT